MPEVDEKFLDVFAFHYISWACPQRVHRLIVAIVRGMKASVLLYSRLVQITNIKYVFVTYVFMSWRCIIYSMNTRPKSGANCMSTIMYVANDIII